MAAQQDSLDTQRSGHTSLSETRSAMKSRRTIGKILLYAICVPALSLPISIPLISYLEDRFALSGAGSSDMATLLVFLIGVF